LVEASVMAAASWHGLPAAHVPVPAVLT
jgi:hypothetical protein